MKKILSFILAAAFMICLLPACNFSNPSDNSLKIVTTIFPIYDWTNTILGDNPANADVSLLLDNGADLHSYQPTADDIMNIANCDLFIYVGGESDEWVNDALAEAVNKEMIVLNLMDILGDKAKQEELAEGMQSEDEAETTDTDEREVEQVEYDEHIWLSVKNAIVLCREIEAAVSKLDKANAEIYQANLDSYIERLENLDEQFETIVEDSPINTLLFGDRFPFRYLTDDYGIKYYAAFLGCSAETEASFETITFLANKVDELSLPYVITIDGSDGKIAETIIQNTKAKNQKILTLNSMQSALSADDSYIKIMQHNLQVIRNALNWEEI